MKKITLITALVLVCLSGFSQTKRGQQKKTASQDQMIPSGELRNDTLFRNVSCSQFTYIRKKYDNEGIAFYYYLGCCSFGEVGGKVPKITEVFIAKDAEGQEHKLITGNKPGSF